MNRFISVSDQAGAIIQDKLEIGRERLRISFCGGPGDVVGTYEHWKAGEADPRVPSVTYSSQLYELATGLNVSLQMISPFAAPSEVLHDIRFDQVLRPKWKGRLGYRGSQLVYLRKVCTSVEDFDPHVVIIGTDFPQSGWKWLKNRRKVILTAHNTFWPMGSSPSGLKGTLKLRFLEHQSKYLDGAVCTSHECRRQIERISDGRIPCFTEHPQIVERHEVQARTQARRLLYLGRIEGSKGVFMLLEAFGRLKPDFPELDLSFAGAGSQDDQLRTAIRDSGLRDVRFLGSLKSAEVHDAISQTDLLVCPTTSGFNEGLALVGFEAAAHGIPTVLSSVVPAMDSLAEGCIAFQADHVDSLTRTLHKVIAEDEVYARLLSGTAPVRARLYERELSWGSQLAKLLQEL